MSKNLNSKWVSYQSNLLISSTLFQITFLKDILSVANILCLILQSDRKNFAAVSWTVKSTIAILEDIQNNVNSIHLQNFKKTDEIIQKLSAIEMHTIASGTTRKKQNWHCGLNKWISQKSDGTIYYSLSCWNFTSVSFIRVPGFTGFVNTWSKSFPWHWKRGVSDLQKQFSENFM